MDFGNKKSLKKIVQCWRFSAIVVPVPHFFHKSSHFRTSNVAPVWTPRGSYLLDGTFGLKIGVGEGDQN